MRRSTPLAVAGLTIVALIVVQGLASFSAVRDDTASVVTTTTAAVPASARVLAAVLADAVTLSPAVLADPYGPESQRGPDMPVLAAPTVTVATPEPVAQHKEPASRPPTTTTTTRAPATTTTAPAPTTTTTTTMATTTTTTGQPTTTTVAGGARDVELWRPLVGAYFPPERVDEALRVIDCESHGDPLAVNPYSGAAGLFQFLPSTWTWSSIGAGFEGASAFDPEANVAAAAWLVARSIETGHSRGAWGHWVCRP